MRRTARIADSHGDRLAVAGLIHSAFEGKGPSSVAASERLNRAAAVRATWWLLESEGEPVSALHCYPLDLAHGRESFRGFGLGAVATAPADRRRGHGAFLCQAVADHAHADGVDVGLLFSAIPPELYEKLGYRVAPHWGWRCESVDAFLASGPKAELAALDARRSLDALVAWYEKGHRGLHVRRDAASFADSLERNPGDLFFSLEGKGYLRVCREKGSLEVLELFGHDEDVLARGLRSAAWIAREMKDDVLEGWVPPAPGLEPWLRDVGRSKTLPMVRGWDELAEARFWGTDYF